MKPTMIMFCSCLRKTQALLTGNFWLLVKKRESVAFYKGYLSALDSDESFYLKVGAKC